MITKIGTAKINRDLISDDLDVEEEGNEGIYYQTLEEIEAQRIVVRAGTVVAIVEKKMNEWLSPKYIQMPNGDLVTFERIERHLVEVQGV